MATIAIVLWQCLDGIMSCWRMALISLGIRRAPMQETDRHRQQAAVWGCKREKKKKSAESEGSCFKNPCVDRCFTDDFPISTLHHNFYLLIILKWNLSGWDITYIILILMNECRYHVDGSRLNIMRIFSRNNSFFEFRLNVSLLWLVFFQGTPCLSGQFSCSSISLYCHEVVRMVAWERPIANSNSW